MTQTKTGSYHHGNLKSALVDAYIELLVDTPPEKLSLRKLANKVGVAATAVYNHFADKDSLMIAVRTRCLTHFGDYLEAHHAAHADPEQNFIELGKTYFRYSKKHADFFKVIFQSPRDDVATTEELITAGMYAEEKLRKSVTQLFAHHNIPNTQYNEGLGAFACWAMAHGITSLAALHINRAACNNGRWPDEFMLGDDDSVDAVFDAIGGVLANGLLVKLKSMASNS